LFSVLASTLVDSLTLFSILDFSSVLTAVLTSTFTSVFVSTLALVSDFYSVLTFTDSLTFSAIYDTYETSVFYSKFWIEAYSDYY